MKNPFEKVSKKENVEVGVVANMVMAVLALTTKHHFYLQAIIILCLITLVMPVLLYPISVLWFGLARILGAISSRIILTIIFFLVVTPVGLCRRMMGRDSMKQKQFKKGRESVMVIRDHSYVAGDLVHTF